MRTAMGVYRYYDNPFASTNPTDQPITYGLPVNLPKESCHPVKSTRQFAPTVEASTSR